MKPILIVVDMQTDFVDGALGTAQAREIVPGVAARIRQAKAAGWRVLFTLDTHAEDYLESAEGRQLPVVHCLRGGEGWKLSAAIAGEAEGCELFEKPTFGSLALANALGRDATEAGSGMQIELIGVCTDICVVSNALILKARLPEADLSVNSSLCAGTTPEKHAAALEVLRSCQVRVF